MKYFLPELLDTINDFDVSSEMREQAEKIWNKNDKEYYDYFQNIEKFFTKTFLNIYFREKGFHDYSIENIEYKKETKKFKSKFYVIIHLKNGEKTYFLIYKNVKVVEINFDLLKYFGSRDYLYDEFYKEENVWSHNILCQGGEIKIACEKIIIKEKKTLD